MLWALVIVLHIPLALLMDPQTILAGPAGGDRHGPWYLVGDDEQDRPCRVCRRVYRGFGSVVADDHRRIVVGIRQVRHDSPVPDSPDESSWVTGDGCSGPVSRSPRAVDVYHDQYVGIDAAKGILSFNLSGPLALATAAAYFSTLDLTPKQCQRLYFCLLAAVVAIGTIVLRNILLAQAIKWTHESNRATSGNFGPNQVSLALGLGAFSALWCMFERGLGWPFRILLFAIVLWLGTQTALTFSRGGMIGAISAGVVAIGFLAGQAETRRKLLLAVPIVVCIAYFVIWPFLVDFTGGALAARYAEVGVTGRDKLTSEDLGVWYKTIPFSVSGRDSRRCTTGTTSRRTPNSPVCSPSMGCLA